MLKTHISRNIESDRNNESSSKNIVVSDSPAAVSIHFSRKIPSDLKKLIQEYIGQSDILKSATTINVVDKKAGEPELTRGLANLTLKVTPNVKLFEKFLQSETKKIKGESRIVTLVIEELKNWGASGFVQTIPSSLSKLISESSATAVIPRNARREREGSIEVVRSQLAILGGPVDYRLSPELLTLAQLASNRDVSRGIANLARSVSITSILLPPVDDAGRVAPEKLSVWADSLSNFSILAVADYLVNRSSSGLQGVLQICRGAQDFIHNQCNKFVRDPGNAVTSEALLGHMEEVELVYSILTRNPFKVVCRIADSELSQNTSALRALNSFYAMSRDEVLVRSSMLRELPELSEAALRERDKNWRGMPEWFSDIEVVCGTPAGSDIRPYRKAVGALADHLLALACSNDEDQRDKFQSMFGEFAAQPQQEGGVTDVTSEVERERSAAESSEIVTKCLWDLDVWARGDFSRYPCPNLHKAEGGILEVARRFIYLRAHDRFEDMFQVNPTDTLRSVVQDLSYMRECLRAHSTLPSCDGMNGYGQMMLAVGEQKCASKVNELLGVMATQPERDDQISVSVRRLEHIVRHRAVLLGGRSIKALLEIPHEVLRSRSEDLVVLLKALFERCEALDSAGKFAAILNCLEPVAQVADILGEQQLRKVVARFCEGLLNELEMMASSVSRGEHGELFKRNVVSELRRWRPGHVFTDTKDRIVRIAGIQPRELV